MLTASHISRRFGGDTILDDISFTINPHDRIGLVGPNGAGKSTLLRVLTGTDTPDAGAVALVPGTTLGYLKQGFANLPQGTLGDLLDAPTHGLVGTYRALEAATARLGDPDDPSVVDAYDRAISAFDEAGGYEALAALEVHLDRFGLGDAGFDRPLDTLSGGQKTRAGLAGLLASSPDLLILDEPTNHLDIDALDWLEDHLRRTESAMLIVSHDRGFLDRIVTRVFELDGETHGLAAYAGTYSDYVAQKAHAEQEQAEAWYRQQKEVRRIKEDIRRMEHHARTIEANTIDFAIRKKAAKIARPAVVRKAKLERMLESEDAVEKPSQSWGLAIDFRHDGAAGGARHVVQLDRASVSFDDREILHKVSLDVLLGDRIALIGPNGSGKSTLLKLVAGDLVPDSGIVRLGAGVKVGYFAQEQDTLDLDRTVLEQVRQEAAMSESDTRTFLHRFLFGGDTVHRQIGALSYGERARLMLALLVLRGTNLLLLDEPLNHLDIASRQRFEQALTQFEGTQIVVLHDRYAIERLATRVIEVRDGVATERDPASLEVSHA
ncbi:MAG: ABC-F family ATP-binding cassette domain-containing protein [Thermomicrobiales bacterium]